MSEEQVEVLLQSISGIEAGRRVGWAKYYESETNFSILSGSTSAREGFVAGVLEKAAEYKIPIKSATRLIVDYLEDRTDEPEDREKYDHGYSEGERLASHYWLHSEESQELDSEEITLGKAKVLVDQCRCGKCNKMFAYLGDDGTLSHKCYRCKHINIVDRSATSTDADK